MDYYIICPRCKNEITITVFPNLRRTIIQCDNCNTHMILDSKMLKDLYRKKNGKKGRFKEICKAALTALVETTGKTIEKVNSMQENYAEAEENLYKRSFDLWNEERLRIEACRTNSLYERFVIKKRLYELQNLSNEDDE